MARRSYWVHRWLSALIGLQLLFWCAGGLIFATHDIAWVRGEDGRRRADEVALTLALADVQRSPAEAALVAAPALAVAPAAEANADVRSVMLRMWRGVPVYEIRSAERVALVDARSGALLSPIDEATARALARDDRVGAPAVLQATQISDNPPLEYRSGALPAWQVVLDDDDNTHVYIDAHSGRITARRNDAWRRFDFFWMLHTMDYRGRDDFNHLLLIVASMVGLVAVLSGFYLWALRLVRRLRRRARRGRDDSSPAGDDGVS